MQLTLFKGNANRRQQKKNRILFTVEMQLTLCKGNTNRRQYKKILKRMCHFCHYIKRATFALQNRLMIKKLSIALVAILTLGSCAREVQQGVQDHRYGFQIRVCQGVLRAGQIQQCRYAPAGSRNDPKGTDNGQECLFMLAMAEYQLKDYEAASETFKKYYRTYPQGVYAETASFYIGQSLYQEHSRGTTGPDTDRGCHRCLPKLPRPLPPTES